MNYDIKLYLKEHLHEFYERLPKCEFGTTSYWDSKIGYIPKQGSIIVYTDYLSETIDGTTINYPNIKIGSGNGYVQDLAFINEKEYQLLIDHINNSNIHVTTADKGFWNNKLNVDDNQEIIGETLIFNRN